MLQRVVPWAISSPEGSAIMKHSEIPTERPAWIVWPELVILAPSRGDTGRTKLSDSSAVVKSTPGPSSVPTHAPSEASAAGAIAPPGISPAELANHGEAGTEKVAWPLETSSNSISIR
jgi:hypothetical protein